MHAHVAGPVAFEGVDHMKHSSLVREDGVLDSEQVARDSSSCGVMLP